MITTHKELAAKLAELERKVVGHDGHIKSLFEAIRRLMTSPHQTSRRIGFRVKEEKERLCSYRGRRTYGG